MMRRYGLGLTVWSPLAFGFLSGAYSREDLAQPDNRFASFDPLKLDRDKGFALLDIMRPIAATRGCTVAQVALAWLLAKDQVSSILVGATKTHQLADNLASIDIRLDEADIAALDAASAITPLYPSSNWIEPDRKLARALEP